MNKFQNKEFKKAYNGKLIAVIVSALAIVLGIFLIITGSNKEKNAKANPYDFGDAYVNNLLDEDIYVFIDTAVEPILLCNYSDGEEYFLVEDYYGEGYIVRCTEAQFNSFKSEITSNGSTHITGSITNLNDEVNDYIREVFSEAVDDPDEYFKGKALYVNGDAGETTYYVFGWIIIGFGFLFCLLALLELLNYNKTLKSLSEVEVAKLESEIDSPATVYHKSIRTFITPNYIVSFGNKFNIVRFDDIIMAYKYVQRYNFVPILSNVKIWTNSNDSELAVADKAGLPGKAKALHEDILLAIHEKNPQANLGYDVSAIKEIQAQKKAAKKQ